jgi:hypothetical protein
MLQYRILSSDAFIFVRVSGLVSLPAWEQMLEALEQALAGIAGDRLVADLTGLVGWLGQPERTAVGALMARRLAGMKKVALFIEAGKITGVVEAEAQRQGLDLRLFPSQAAAVDWVLA